MMWLNPDGLRGAFSSPRYYLFEKVPLVVNLSRSEAEGSIPLHVYVPSLGHQILDSDVKLCFRVLN